MKLAKLFLLTCFTLLSISAQTDKITIAAASDLKFAMDEIVSTFKQANPADQIDLAYGSSGNFNTQIQQGAPFDLFFSADIGFPRELVKNGLATSEVKLYALRRNEFTSS